MARPPRTRAIAGQDGSHCAIPLLATVVLISSCCSAVETQHLRRSAAFEFEADAAPGQEEQSNRQLNTCFDGLCSDDPSYVSRLGVDCKNHAPWFEGGDNCFDEWVKTSWLKFAYREDEIFGLIGKYVMPIE